MTTNILSVERHELGQTIRFYTQLFGADPVALSANGAHWSIESLGIDFTITVKQHTPARREIRLDKPVQLGVLTVSFVANNQAQFERPATTVNRPSTVRLNQLSLV